DAEKRSTVHRRRQWLRTTHAAEAAGQNEFSVERSAEMLPPGSSKSFKRTLHDSLATDVNPRTGRHLSVHRQSHPLEPIELGVIIPLTDKIRVRDQNPRGFIMRAEFPDRLSRLNEKRFVVFELTQHANDCVETSPASRGAASSAVNNQSIGVFSDVRIEVVHQHPHRRLLVPAFACTLTTARGVNNSLFSHSSFVP